MMTSQPVLCYYYNVNQNISYDLKICRLLFLEIVVQVCNFSYLARDIWRYGNVF